MTITDRDILDLALQADADPDGLPVLADAILESDWGRELISPWSLIERGAPGMPTSEVYSNAWNIRRAALERPTRTVLPMPF